MRLRCAHHSTRDTSHILTTNSGGLSNNVANMDSTRHQKYAFGLSGRAVGLVLIFLTAIIWVAASFISQLLVNTEEGKSSFNVSPFLLTYLSTSIFTIFLPIVQLKSLLQNTLALRLVCLLAWSMPACPQHLAPLCT